MQEVIISLSHSSATLEDLGKTLAGGRRKAQRRNSDLQLQLCSSLSSFFFLWNQFISSFYLFQVSAVGLYMCTFLTAGNANSSPLVFIQLLPNAMLYLLTKCQCGYM